MPFCRSAVPMWILLVLLGGQFAHAAPQTEPPPGKNSIHGLQLAPAPGGDWTAEFDYSYTGEPSGASVAVEVTSYARESGNGTPQRAIAFMAPAQQGTHHVRMTIGHQGAVTTSQVTALMRHSPTPGSPVVVASQQVESNIVWPDFRTYAVEQQLAKGTPEESLGRAVALIDFGAGFQLTEAKMILEHLLRRNPQLDQGYVELARIAMKTAWGPEGLHQAESLLSSALQIRPDSANAKILLGYVYTHQKHFAKAEALFVDAAKSNPRNLWLWANWGEMLAMQGKVDQAIVKYREALARPMTRDTYDRARLDAYRNLLKLLEQRKDLDGMEALYKQRVAEFGPGSCYSTDYARFLLNVRGDTQGAIDLATRALNQNCEDSHPRQIIGLGEYVKWASTTGPDGAEALHRARVYLPASPTALYQLASSDRTQLAAKKLVESGEAIDQKDNNYMTALAYALQDHNLAAAKRLLTLGASPDVIVGPEEMPLALLPVIEGDVEAVTLMLQFGVDYSKIRFHGATAYDFAREADNSALLEKLGPKETTL